MLEPRRIAARAAADFIARQRGERTGATIGYRVRNDSRTSDATRLEIVTEGILTRMIQEDPSLESVGMIIFDEFHERSLHADLALALSLEAQRALRPDLRIVIMSATIDAQAVAALVGNAEIIQSPGRQHPVEMRYRAQAVERFIDTAAADTVRRALREEDGDILVFLPGRSEIFRTAEKLESDPELREINVLRLHSEIPPGEQDQILNPGPSGKRRVILATNIAETSITIPNVRIVVDTGLMRVPRFNVRRGVSGLETVRVSLASAAQRAGRAGRQTAGVCYRLWTEREQQELAPFNSPDILHEDLSSFLLELAAWGSTDVSRYALLTTPHQAQVDQALSVLRALDALDETRKITAHGRALLRFSLHPRLSSLLLKAKDLGLAAQACDVAALLEENSGGGDRELDQILSNRFESLRQLRAGRDSVRSNAWKRVDTEAQRLRRMINAPESAEDSSADFGALVALAYPERVAMQREANGTRYLLRSGTGATVPERSPLARHPFLAVAHLDGSGANAKIFLAESIDADEIERVFSSQIDSRREVIWDSQSQSIRAREVRALGSLILADRPVAARDDEAAPLFLAAVADHGISALPFKQSEHRYRERSEWLRTRGIGSDTLPDLSEQKLLETMDEWLVPFTSGFRKLRELENIELDQMLAAHLSYHTKQLLDKLAPVDLLLPTGRRVTIDYQGERAPAISARLQELFGQRETPAIAAGKIPLTIHLLSPAGRPLQVTSDLESFWKNSYEQVRKEMQGRYPKHSWPTNPLEAEPMRGTKRHHHQQQQK